MSLLKSHVCGQAGVPCIALSIHAAAGDILKSCNTGLVWEITDILLLLGPNSLASHYKTKHKYTRLGIRFLL